MNDIFKSPKEIFFTRENKKEEIFSRNIAMPFNLNKFSANLDAPFQYGGLQYGLGGKAYPIFHVMNKNDPDFQNLYSTVPLPVSKIRPELISNWDQYLADIQQAKENGVIIIEKQGFNLSFIKNFKNNLLREKYAKIEKEIWFHGTSAKNLQSITQNGLIINPENKVWDKDDNTGFYQPSRQSLDNSIYLTKNLGTATSSAIGRNYDRNFNSLIIICEINPKTLFADEDDVSYHARTPYYEPGRVSDNPYTIKQLYMGYMLGTNFEGIEKIKNNYIEKSYEDLTYQLKEKKEIHPGLELRIKQLLSDNWDKALKRQVAYLGEPWYDWNRAFWDISTKEQREVVEEKWNAILNSNPDMSDEERSDKYRELMRFVIPQPPDKGEAEHEYALFMDRLSRTAKFFPRVKNYNKTARITENIGFRGANKIIGIAEYNRNYEVKIIYGYLPEDFISQWESHMSKPIKMVDEFSKQAFNLKKHKNA